MNGRLKQIICVMAVLFSGFAMAQEPTPIVVPAFGDNYSNYVKKLEAGDMHVDFRAFRESFIESPQFEVANQQKPVMDSLKRAMYEAMHYKNYAQIISITRQMLSIDYTCLLAHKILQQTYKYIGDTLNQKKYHDIEFGLLHSIINNGDGKTCETGWPVIQIDEEYFILEIQGAKLLQQSMVTEANLCDKMDTQTKEGNKTFYIETSKVFEGYKKLGLQ